MGSKFCVDCDMESNNDIEVKVVSIFELMMYVKYVGVV